ncbi:hypothetical protein AAHC03_09225 [Spirometra sp. Aus1]
MCARSGDSNSRLCGSCCAADADVFVLTIIGSATGDRSDSSLVKHPQGALSASVATVTAAAVTASTGKPYSISRHPPPPPMSPFQNSCLAPFPGPELDNFGFHEERETD